MRLTDLDPGFLYGAEDNGRFRGFGREQATAQGIWFDCPVCSRKPQGSHSVRIWFKDRGVPDHLEPTLRWSATGASFEDLTLNPSVNLNVNGRTDCWHGNITAGEIVGGI